MCISTYFPVSDFINMLYIVNCKSFSLTLFSTKGSLSMIVFYPSRITFFSIEEVQRNRGKQPPSSDIRIPNSSQLEDWTSHIVLLKNAFIVYFSGGNSVKQLRKLYVVIMSCTSFRVNLHSIVCLNVKELLA